MMQRDMSSYGVAESYFEQHGYSVAVDMVMGRLHLNTSKQDLEFWLDVLNLLEDLEKRQALGQGCFPHPEFSNREASSHQN
ncbi:hypothetical protein [Terasakiella sp. SH-1]|uniref:hypothetical protein n=1 Tax=Terasakiella sp. SH-1 TaxID=2560057 RepID=UPI0010749A91|nr:hypothetical protein [Terasakiella sp. SH-1]